MIFPNENWKEEVYIQIDEDVGGRVVEGEEALGFVGLLDDGVYVVDVGNGFQNLLVLVLVEAALFVGLLEHLVVVLDQCPAKPSFLVLSHGFSETKHPTVIGNKTLEWEEAI